MNWSTYLSACCAALVIEHFTEVPCDRGCCTKHHHDHYTCGHCGKVVDRVLTAEDVIRTLAGRMSVSERYLIGRNA